MNSFISLLAVLFIAMKLIGIEPVSAWSWAVVLLPVYTGCAAVFVGTFTCLVVALFTQSETATTTALWTTGLLTYILVPLVVIFSA